MNVLVKYFSITQQTVFSLRCSSPGALLFRYGESFLRGRWTAGYRQSSVHAGNKTPSIHVHPRAFDVHGRPWIHVHPPRGSAVRGSTSMDRWMDGSERLLERPFCVVREMFTRDCFLILFSALACCWNVVDFGWKKDLLLLTHMFLVSKENIKYNILKKNNEYQNREREIDKCLHFDLWLRKV